ncbi:hypothetical protein C0992_012715 [Termitomyces sp. T32_za158]|nr:hypothetical protein C0992_012715 [Termitomyces sp. T32_za158]
MTRASISSLVGTAKGRSLLWIHTCLLFWVTLTWMMALLWICNGAFKFRKARLELLSKRLADNNALHHPHPHPQYGFADIHIAERSHSNRGIRLRTVMVSNIPKSLRNEKDLKEYFEFYMSRKLEKPSMRLALVFQPGFFNRLLAFLFNRGKRIQSYMPPIALLSRGNNSSRSDGNNEHSDIASFTAEDVPDIERVVIIRKMSSIASLLERREAILCLLETAHIKLAKRTLLTVKDAMCRRHANLPVASGQNRAVEISRKRRAATADPERGTRGVEVDEEARLDELIEVLGPFVEEFGLQESLVLRSKRFLSASSRYAFQKLGSRPVDDTSDNADSPCDSPPRRAPLCRHETVWEALHSLPRSSLDAYQPLINLNHLFAGKTVPAIDYYTTKLNILSSLVTESRSKAPSDYEPLSTAFVTFSDAADARRACKYLAVHPNNPLVCMVNMAPMYQDLDWMRVMKSSFDVEGVHFVLALPCFLAGRFSLYPEYQPFLARISGFPYLVANPINVLMDCLSSHLQKNYLNRHAWEEELIQSFLPTLLVALLALLIPLILLLIAKKAHNLTTLSAMHDIIMTRYYKFLIVNVLVFFCVGTAALQSLLQSFNPSATPPDILQVVADSFPTAGPFYVGWRA